MTDLTTLGSLVDELGVTRELTEQDEDRVAEGIGVANQVLDLAAGDVIGAVGNSGASDTPHLHIGYQRRAEDPGGAPTWVPIPILFSDYRIVTRAGEDRVVERGRPRRGQFVAGPRRGG